MMINQNVIIYLNTPLIETGVEEGRVALIARLKGKILAQGSEGFLLQTKAAGDKKGWNDSTTVKKIFVPVHKVDYIVVE